MSQITGKWIADNTIESRSIKTDATFAFAALTTTGDATIGGDATIIGDLSVGGAFDLSGSEVTFGNLNVSGDASVSGNLDVGGGIDISGAEVVIGSLKVTDDATVNDTMDVGGDFRINTNRFTVGASSGDTSVGGNLAVRSVFQIGDSTIDSIGQNIKLSPANGYPAIINGDLQVNRDAYMSRDATIVGGLSLGHVSGDLQASGNVVVVGDTTLGSTLRNSSLFITGYVYSDWDLGIVTCGTHRTLNLDSFSADHTGHIILNPDTAGDVVVDGNSLQVAGDATVAGVLSFQSGGYVYSIWDTALSICGNQNTLTLDSMSPANNIGYVVLNPDSSGTVTVCGQNTSINSQTINLKSPQPIDMTSTSSLTMKTAGSLTFDSYNSITLSTDTTGSVTINPTTAGTVTICGDSQYLEGYRVYMPYIQTGSDQALNIDSGTGQLLRNTSSLKYKEDVASLGFDSSSVYGLNAVSFTWKNLGKRDFGYIAEDAYMVVPQLVSCRDGTPDGFRYDMLSVLVMEELKKIKSRLDNAGL